MANLSDQLNATPQGKQLLENQAALQKLLSTPEAQQMAALLGRQDSARLQQAAQAALQGNTAPLQGVLQELTQDPQAAQAMTRLQRDLHQ